ncbi:MAG: SpoIIE family protein phosphatase [Desulfotalea sp.]
MIKFTSLKHKVAILIILPLCLIMISAGTLGMRLISNTLLKQWEETAISKLQRSAHEVDMRLMRPKEILTFFQQTDQQNLSWREINLLIKQLKSIDGVVKVGYSFTENNQQGMGNRHRLKKTTISSLSYNTELKSQTISIIASFTNSTDASESYIEVVVSFYDLIDQIVKAPWWQGNIAFILDQDGKILARTERNKNTGSYKDNNEEIFPSNNSLEIETWNAIQNKEYGTLFSQDMPPSMVSGFYHLKQAPWTLVIMASGATVLQPIISFRNYYYLICVVGILCFAIYLWFMTNRITSVINRLSIAANNLAKGVFGTSLTVESRDEIGDLTNSFNTMSKQLKERLQLRQEMSLAGEIQANLLPKIGFQTEGMDVAVFIKYCDETGGDYVDILKTNKEKQRVTVVVGDVVGHGVGASLLMTTLRALLRCRVNMPGSMAEVANDVNYLLCQDTVRAGNFATLFYLTIDRLNQTLEWVRCGHEPALIYCPKQDSFHELKGKGMAMGLDEQIVFTQNSLKFIDENQIILVGTDGIWDVENAAGEQFGKTRTQSIIVKNAHLSAKEIVVNIIKEIDQFRFHHPQNDDITLAIIKTES